MSPRRHPDGTERSDRFADSGDADWSSNDNLIASIPQGGLLTGLIPGSNVVSARYAGASASQPVHVTPF